MKTVYSVCGMCGTRCPVAVGVENGEAVWIQGNPHSATGSTLCPRGIAALALEKDSERPQSPLMRVGARGGHKWRAVGWEEALDAVAGKLRVIRDQYGPESIMFSHRGGPFTDLYKAFARGLGTPNIYSHSVTCTRNADQACASVLGLDRGRLVIDYRESKHIVLQSRNALEALNLSEVAGITAARANGCKVTVMDVRATVSAAKADTFFLVRPGTDYAMNLAVLHVLISEKLYDPQMLPYIDGFGELEERVRPCTPEWAETETGIKADRIVMLARELAEAAPASSGTPAGSRPGMRTASSPCAAPTSSTPCSAPSARAAACPSAFPPRKRGSGCGPSRRFTPMSPSRWRTRPTGSSPACSTGPSTPP